MHESSTRLVARAQRFALCTVAAAGVLWVSPAWALTQPASTTLIPTIDQNASACSDFNVQLCLNEAEGGATIDAQQDGHITPETFDPRCNLTFHILNRGAGYLNVFGWYNVKADPDNPGKTLKPAVEELYTFILASEQPPATRTLELRNDPNYLGGEIGFFMATGSKPSAEVGGPPSNYDNIFYSERAHNPPEPNTTEPSIHLIVWQSVTYKDSFYFGWEDLLTGNDNDFDDIFTRVEGIQCAGGGENCDTGQAGVCREGTLQCQQGELTCVANTSASDEKCNALDDDCNGQTDDGEALCQDDYICDRGNCVPRCGTGEFRCATHLVCSDVGACVDPLCVDVACPEGQICEAGQCTDACSGVTCPYGRVCRVGVCVDPCATISCDEGYTCHLGVCADCDCGGCGTGESCVADVCVDDTCAAVSCNVGTHCAAGDCVDDCEGASCPGGAACAAGECAAPDGSVGGSGGTTVISGSSGGSIVVGSGASAGTATSNGGSSGGTSGNVATPRDIASTSDCACRLVSNTDDGALLAWLSAAGALAVGLRRSGRRRARRAG